MMNDPTALYRFYDDGGRLLYVGISKFPEKRLRQHQKDKWWFPLVGRRKVEWHGDRPSAVLAEATAIRRENPLYNKARDEDVWWYRLTRLEPRLAGLEARLRGLKVLDRGYCKAMEWYPASRELQFLVGMDRRAVKPRAHTTLVLFDAMDGVLSQLVEAYDEPWDDDPRLYDYSTYQYAARYLEALLPNCDPCRTCDAEEFVA
jgi:predicted GIY-YIG superfamily endonuclease